MAGNPSESVLQEEARSREPAYDWWWPRPDVMCHIGPIDAPSTSPLQPFVHASRCLGVAPFELGRQFLQGLESFAASASW